MRTRSSARNLFPPLDNPKLTIRRRSRVDPTHLKDFEMATEGNGDPPIPDLQTMEELCQPSLNGRAHNEITNFRQCPNGSLFEAWECYKLSIDRCPNHNMLPVTQIDIFYNGLTLRHRDTINAATGGTFMKRRPEECYDLIENMTAHHNDWDTSAQWSDSSSSITSSSDLEIVALKAEMKEINKNLMKNVYAAGAYQGGNSYQPQGDRNLLSYRLDNYLGPPGFNQNHNRNNQNQNFQNQNRNQGNNHGIPQGNNQGRNQIFQGASHGSNPPLAYQAPVYQASSYQAPVHQPSIPQPQVVTTTEFTNYMKANDAILNNMETNMTSLTNSNLELKNIFGQFMKMNNASSSGSGTLPSNIVTNPKEDLKMDECLALADLSARINLMPLSVWNKLSLPELTPTLMTLKLADRSISRPIGVTEDVYRYFLKTKRDLIDVYAGELTLRVNNEAVTFNLDQTLRYSANYKDMTVNLIDVIDMDCEKYSQEVLGFSDVIASGNPTPYYDPIVSTSSPTLTPFGDSDFLLEEVNAFLALEDDATSPKVDHSYYDPEGDIILLEAFLNDDPSLSPPNQGKYLPQV
nr:reverse transcriptase domain-containing protein [Tanacetum cinerariifolium]